MAVKPVGTEIYNTLVQSFVPAFHGASGSALVGALVAGKKIFGVTIIASNAAVTALAAAGGLPIGAGVLGAKVAYYIVNYISPEDAGWKDFAIFFVGTASAAGTFTAVVVVSGIAIGSALAALGIGCVSTIGLYYVFAETINDKTQNTPPVEDSKKKSDADSRKPKETDELKGETTQGAGAPNPNPPPNGTPALASTGAS